MNRAQTTPGLAAALLVLAGCASFPGQEKLAAPRVTVDDFLAMMPADRKQDVFAAQRELFLAERRASRAELALPIAEQRLRMARADLDARRAAAERAESNLRLVNKEHQALFAGAPVNDRSVPEDVQRAVRRLEEVEHAVYVARWEQDQAEAAVRLREQERYYASAFRDATKEEAGVERAAMELARTRLVSQATSCFMPGVVDARLALAQSGLRDAQAAYTKAHAEATERLQEVQVRRLAMNSFDAGPPALILSNTPGRSGAAQLVPVTREVAPAPLPWPDAWEETPPAAPARRQEAPARR